MFGIDRPCRDGARRRLVVPPGPCRCLSWSGQRESAARSRRSSIPLEESMKKAIIGFVSLLALGMLLQLAQPRNGADDPCGGCPKDFKCDLASLQCVPEDPHP